MRGVTEHTADHTDDTTTSTVPAKPAGGSPDIKSVTRGTALLGITPAPDAHPTEKFCVLPDRYKTSLCRHWMRGPQHCAYGADCVYAHGESELRSRDANAVKGLGARPVHDELWKQRKQELIRRGSDSGGGRRRGRGTSSDGTDSAGSAEKPTVAAAAAAPRSAPVDASPRAGPRSDAARSTERDLGRPKSGKAESPPSRRSNSAVTPAPEKTAASLPPIAIPQSELERWRARFRGGAASPPP